MHTEWKLIGRTGDTTTRIENRDMDTDRDRDQRDHGPGTWDVSDKQTNNQTKVWAIWKCAHNDTKSFESNYFRQTGGRESESASASECLWGTGYEVWRMGYGNGSVRVLDVHGVQWINLRYVTKPQLQAQRDKKQNDNYEKSSECNCIPHSTDDNPTDSDAVAVASVAAIATGGAAAAAAVDAMYNFWGQSKWRGGLDLWTFLPKAFLGDFCSFFCFWGPRVNSNG